MTWRIRGRRAFGALARSGRRARTQTLWCNYLNDLEAVPIRVAYAVGRSIGPAAHRNRLRRRLRAAVATVLHEEGHELQLDHGLLLIGATPAASKHTFASLRDEVRQLLRLTSPGRGRCG